jgi:hypothetical protein
LPPVPNLDDETLSRISYQYGIPQPQSLPVEKASNFINPEGFMSKINSAATEIKLNSLPATPISVETLAAIDSAAANVDSGAGSVSNSSEETVTSVSSGIEDRRAHQAARAAARAAKKAALKTNLSNNPFSKLENE